MRKILFVIALGLVSACGSPPEPEAPAARADQPGSAPPFDPPPLEPIPMDASAGPSGQDSMTWIFTPVGVNGHDYPVLMYSARSNDEMALNLRCDAGAVRALIVRQAPVDEAPTSWPFTLQSGAARVDLVGAIDGAQDGLLTVAATVPLDDAVMSGFRESGQITLRDQGGARAHNAINDGERQIIRDFFSACA